MRPTAPTPIAIPNPAPAMPPGFDAVNTLLSWATGIGVVISILITIGLAIIAIASTRGKEWADSGKVLIGFAAAIVIANAGMLVGRSNSPIQMPPGTEAFVTMMSWLKWIAPVVGVLSLIAKAILALVDRRGDGLQNVAGIGMTLVLVSLVGVIAPLVAFLVGA